MNWLNSEWIANATTKPGSTNASGSDSATRLAAESSTGSVTPVS